MELLKLVVLGVLVYFTMDLSVEGVQVGIRFNCTAVQKFQQGGVSACVLAAIHWLDIAAS